MDKPFYIGEYDFFFLIFNISKLFCSWESGRKDYIDNDEFACVDQWSSCESFESFIFFRN